jgi:hypothetical protein
MALHVFLAVTAFCAPCALLAVPSSFAQAAVKPAYRVQVYSNVPPRLPVNQDWSLKYRFTVPPLPTSPTWDYNVGTVYQWGDVDFDSYGSNGTWKLSDYRFNQIVPQLVLGNVLDGSDAKSSPSWSHVRTWHIQAQYYWYNATSAKSYAQTGRMVAVNPGDRITSSITYNRRAGTIVASIADIDLSRSSGESTITIVRPFPNEPSLFTSWTDFFTKAAAASQSSYVKSTPAVDVETDYLDQQTMCGLLPLVLAEISIPGITPDPSSFSIQELGGFTCPQPVVRFSFGANSTS